MKLVLEVLANSEYGVISDMAEIGAVGHRVVHGGEGFADSVVIDDAVKKVIKDCFEIAPLHNPPNLMGIEALPGINAQCTACGCI
jgi:acetate kinase